MLIRMKFISAGPDANYPADAIRDFPEAEAKRLIATRQADPAPPGSKRTFSMQELAAKRKQPISDEDAGWQMEIKKRRGAFKE